MIEKSVLIFTEKEEEFVILLIEMGLRKNVAKTLVYLNKTPEATLRDIELGIDETLIEVSLTIKYLLDQEWVTWWKVPLEKRPYWLKKYKLAVPFAEIVEVIEKQKKEEACNQNDTIKKIWDYI